MSKLLLGAMSLEAGNGGIARVARMMARVLKEEHLDPVAVLNFHDRQMPADVGYPGKLALGSRVRFTLSALTAASQCNHFLYDGVQLAQVHRLPLLARKQVLAYLHGVEIWENAPASYVKSARRADLLVCNSHYTLKRAIANHGPFPQAKVCWLATETDEPPVSSTKRQPQVLIVGRMSDEDRYKGHRELIACWPQVVGAVPDALLRIVGRGPEAPVLERLAAESSVAKNIRFEGFVEEAALDRLYAESTVFAMPSRGEGFGLVYIEAMRHGLPVIASVHDAAPEIVLDGETGYTVNLDQPEELPNRLIRLLQDSALARQFGEAGRKRWHDHFRYRAFRERFSPILKEFLA